MEEAEDKDVIWTQGKVTAEKILCFQQSKVDSHPNEAFLLYTDNL